MGGGNDTYTKILLHMDGANAGTTFTDNNAGGSAHTWTAHGTTSTSTTQAKFGNASFNDGGSVSGLDYIDTPDSTDFTLGSGDFTVDFWCYISGGNGTTRFLCGQLNSSASLICFDMAINTSNKFVANVYTTDGSTDIAALVGTNAYTSTGWNHIALVRHGSAFNLYINGTSEANATSASAVYDSSDNYAIGRGGVLAADSWNGYIDEFRLSVGIARWTTTFTPPTQAYGPTDLSPAAGSFSLSGKATTQQISRLTSKGTFTLTGVSQTLTKAWKPLSAAVGAFTLTGVATTRAISRLTSRGIFTLTGQVANQLQVRHVLAGAFTLTGIAANLFKSQNFICGTGSFTLTGTAVKFVHQTIAGFGRIRQTIASLYQVRTTAPELED